MKLLILFFLCSFLLYTGCNTYTQGERIYQSQCGNCHGMKGEGLASLYPALQNSSILEERSNTVPCIINKGKFTLDDKGNKISEMPPIPDMKEVEMTNLINYLNKEFTKNQTAVTVDSVLKWRNDCN